MSTNGQRLAWRIPEAAEYTGLSTAMLRKLIGLKKIKITKAGRATLIRDEDLREYLDSAFVGEHVIKPLSTDEKARRAESRAKNAETKKAA